MIRFFPIYNPEAIKRAWPSLIDGVEKVKRFSGGEIRLEAVFNDLMSGGLLLWVAYEDKKWIGFITTRINEIPFGDKYMIIEHIYANSKIPDDLYVSGMKQLENHAKKWGCKTIRFYTKRDRAFEKTLGKFDFKNAFAVFEKEV